MIKRLFLIIALLLSCVWSEEDSQWKSYFGVEAGVGLMDIEPGFLASINLGLLDIYYLRGLSYGAGILGGWQKYTSEKVGMRNTLGLRVFGTKDTKAGDDKYKEREGLFISDSTFYYALDGLFDFTKNGENRFGMSLGFSTDILHLTLGGAGGFGWFINLASRVGFYAQFDNKIIELMASVPLGGIGIIEIGYNSTLTFSYKYLF